MTDPITAVFRRLLGGSDHQHDWHVIRTSHHRYTGWFTAGSPLCTITAERCRGCGKLRAGEYEGWFTADELNGKAKP